jgi:hypothetical protein
MQPVVQTGQDSPSPVVVQILNAEISASRLYDKTYFSLLQIHDLIKRIDASSANVTPASKPIATQVYEFFQRSSNNTNLLIQSGETSSGVSIQSPGQTLRKHLEDTPAALRYSVLEHATKDLQLQLSYMIARGVSVYALEDAAVFAVEVSPNAYRYLLLTDKLSAKGGSTSAFHTFLVSHVGLEYQDTKLSAYIQRLEQDAEAEWI